MDYWYLDSICRGPLTGVTVGCNPTAAGGGGLPRGVRAGLRAPRGRARPRLAARRLPPRDLRHHGLVLLFAGPEQRISQVPRHPGLGGPESAARRWPRRARCGHRGDEQPMNEACARMCERNGSTRWQWNWHHPQDQPPGAGRRWPQLSSSATATLRSPAVACTRPLVWALALLNSAHGL